MPSLWTRGLGLSDAKKLTQDLGGVATIKCMMPPLVTCVRGRLVGPPKCLLLVRVWAGDQGLWKPPD